MAAPVSDDDMLDWLTDMIRELAAVSRTRHPEVAGILEFAAVTCAKRMIANTLEASEMDRTVLEEFRRAPIARRA